MVVDDVAADGMRRPCMREEGVHIVPAIPDNCLLVLEFQDESGGVFWNLDEEDLVDGFSRKSGSSVALGDLPQGDVASQFGLDGRDVETFNEDVEVALEDCLLRGVALHVQIIRAGELVTHD